MTNLPTDPRDPMNLPVLLQRAAYHLQLAERTLAEASESPEDAFDPLAEKSNLAFLSECLTRHEILADRLRRVVSACRKAYHPGGR
ncbi:MAG: hypothetical protein ACO1SV_07450 [Fimbriimonas sp.]